LKLTGGLKPPIAIGVIIDQQARLALAAIELALTRVTNCRDHFIARAGVTEKTVTTRGVGIATRGANLVKALKVGRAVACGFTIPANSSSFVAAEERDADNDDRERTCSGSSFASRV